MATNPRSSRKKRTRTNQSPCRDGKFASQHTLFGESSFLEQNRVTVATVQRSQRAVGFCKDVSERAQTADEARRDSGGNAGTPVLSRLRTWGGRLLDGSHQVCGLDSTLCLSSTCNASSERLPSFGTGYVSRALALGGCSRYDGHGNAGERRGVQHVGYLRTSELCSLTSGQVIQPLRGSVARSWALFLAPRRSESLDNSRI